MIKTLNKYINLSMILSILFIIVGVILIIWPKTSLETISYMIGAFLLVYGIYNFIDSFSINPIFCFVQMTSSVLAFVLGIIIFLNPTIFESLIPIVLGIFFIINGSFKTRLSFIIKDVSDNWILSLITSILMIICGVLLIINPKITAIMLTTMVGILLVVYSVADIVDMVVFKSRVKDIYKYFEKLLK